MAHNNASWGGVSPAGEEVGPQVRPMGLKVHYTFDKDGQERCLARWPHILHIQTIPVEGQTIGVIDLGLCLQAVSQGSPELAGDEDRDYAIYAFDYSEPDTPLVGQGLLSWGLSLGPEPREPRLITGRVTKNLLAIFGNGIRETLEVKLKLTAISKIPRNEPIQRPHSAAAPPPNLPAPSSAVSDNGEWGSFVQSHPGLGQKHSALPMNLPTLAPAPVRPYNSSFEARNDVPQHYPTLQPAPSSRSGSVDPNAKERNTPSFRHTPPLAPARQSPMIDEGTSSQLVIKPAKPQAQSRPNSRPNSRASSRPPTGRPRGRPRKRPLASEGNTSGYEDGTDGDDAPSRMKKRATTTKVERSNTATFGSAPESLRVAASTAGSIRNFRPVAPAGDGSVRNRLQEEGPRAPTPVPEPRFQGHTHPRAMAHSNLGRQSMVFPTLESAPNPSYPDPNGSMSQDARSPMDSVAPSPFSDEPSPADISSSPPVPRSAMYSIQSSPAPSSPTLPPMRAPAQQLDSGFMSGGLEDSRMEEELTNKPVAASGAPIPLVTKPKPRRSRAKKQEPKPQQTLHIHTETPGPPELLPQTSIYNPPRPQGSRKKSTASAPIPVSAPVTASINTTAPEMMESTEIVAADEGLMHKTEQLGNAASPSGIDALQAALNEYPDSQQFLDTLDIDLNSFSPADDIAAQENGTPISSGLNDRKMEPPAVPTPTSEPSVEPELPAVPASDPVLPQLSQTVPMSGGLHPQTDAVDGMESRMNKNYVKRQAIKQKLEEAVALGQMPSFCSNCGALQTPTWRKIWKQERHGVPMYHEYSEKPGHVTAINVLERDDTGNPTLYEVIKKSLGSTDDKSKWTETILCNPCGIWFSKWKAHRPPEKWEKDEQRLTQTRKKRAAGGGPSRSRKGRAKSDGPMTLASEACLPTDPIGPSDTPQSPKEPATNLLNPALVEDVSEKSSEQNRDLATTEPKDQGSTHSRASRASGTAMSPIDLDDELGATRRLLFPSPRKNGEQKILGEVAVNIVQTGPRVIDMTDREMNEKKSSRPRGQTPEPSNSDFVELFGPTPRPSTPPPKRVPSGSFKTPTQPTPNHRPVTRSVSKSMHSTRSLASPSQGFPERTPTRTPCRGPRRTPRSGFPSGGRPRRSPRHLPSEAIGENGLGTPLTNSISQMFSDTDHLMMPSPSRDFGIDFHSLSHLDVIDQHGDLPQFDFATLLGTDSLMPSSPPALRSGEMLSFGGSLEFDMEQHNLEFRPSPRRGADAMQSVNDDEQAP
ncbi:putative GATA transcription factor [Rosellinia necatrix]|uniref:Putative GATA transcription factor n=1 Tax=Rosellinia necatrix TaxID=77044 RepID=A0A1W2TSD8_ROSNE|nr:putative GATA transcription factor [Rosellinia necatrix]